VKPLRLYLEISAVTFVACLVLISLSNWRRLRRLDRYPPPARTPRVSVPVPARNEQEHTGDCACTLLGQNSFDFEVVVLKDHSTDRTGMILAEGRGSV
jgi:cellulose synthase/poly-beta-1,6-N-acetylglucosamine synthase-like glycosyltransferase